LRRFAFPLQGVNRHGEKYQPLWFRSRCARRFSSEPELSLKAVDLPLPSETEAPESSVWDEVRSCLELARWTQTVVASGDRLTAARAAVELVRAYDGVLEKVRLIPLSLPELQSVRDRLAPVTELLRKYRLR
jgi:hypothetical protein